MLKALRIFIFFMMLAAQVATAAAADPYTYKVDWAFFQGRAVAALWLEPGPEYHTYSHNPGEGAMPTRVGVFDEKGTAVPAAVSYLPGVLEEDAFDPGVMVRVYNGPTPVFLSFPESLPVAANEAGGFFAHVSLLACSDKHCLPVKAIVPLMSADVPDLAAVRAINASPDWLQALTASEPGEALKAPVRLAGGPALSLPPLTQSAVPTLTAAPLLPEISPDWDFSPRPFLPALEVGGLGKALLFGLLAGLILNIMPCVLPVLTLKLSTLASGQAGQGDEERRRHFRSHNLWFAAGIMLWFLGLALLFGLAGLAWGQLFQNVTVVSLLLLLVFALGLSMFGLFHLPVLDLRLGRSGSPRAQALASGLLATLLATPCSGPLLGGVLGWSMGQPLPVLITVFAATGLGMALPYLLLALRPGAVRYLPRPGNWMLVLEKLMGFFLMGTALYLFSILPASLHISMLAVLLVSALAAWVWGHWGSLRASGLRRLLLGSGCALAVVLSLWLCLRPAPPHALDWKPFDAQALRMALGTRPVLLEFTADWCPTCKVLERTSLAPDHLGPLAERYNLLLMRVDMTREDEARQELLRALGSASIPLTALFPVKESLSPVVLRDIYSPGQLEEALALAFPREP